MLEMKADPPPGPLSHASLCLADSAFTQKLLPNITWMSLLLVLSKIAWACVVFSISLPLS